MSLLCSSCWFRCRCGEDIRAPTVAVRVVFVMAQCWFPMVQAVQLTIEILKLQLIDKVFHVPVCWLCELVGPCTQVHGQGFPRHQGGEGVAGDAGSLLPGVLPPELVASSARARTDSPCRQLLVPHNNTTHITHTTHTTHTTHNTQQQHTTTTKPCCAETGDRSGLSSCRWFTASCCRVYFAHVQPCS